MKTKALLIISIIALSFTTLFSQNPQREVGNGMGIDNLKREDYIIVSNVKGESSSTRFWLLFIPIGGSSKTQRENRAYKEAVYSCKCDGLISPVYDEKRFVIPLIVINFSFRKTTVTGKGYIIKTDADKNATITKSDSVVISTKPPTNPIIPINSTKPNELGQKFSLGEKVLFQNAWYKWIEGEIVQLNANTAKIRYVKDGKIRNATIKYYDIKKP